MVVNKLVVYKWFFSFEKEEHWLEQMSAQGWHFTKVSSFYGYTFVKGAPEKRIYKIDFRKLDPGKDRDDYIALFADAGWQCIEPARYNYSFYFYTTQDGAARDIFSDNASRANRYLRYAQISLMSLLPAFIPFLALYMINAMQPQKILYLTPGLWEMKGWEFIKHFLFETPFVLMRAGAYLLPALVLLFALFFLLRYVRLYRKLATEG